ncbi:iron transporter [Rubrivivax gelatinosus]|uniref:Iron transporter n=2 Tax=Rubrivivax gelatinosus TaxID=28068 RepID=A0ABS1DYS4_RUBGE|nr:TonB-dependent receptor [Rubrivivax gelatinosus]MBK1715242.1 iron transporter [Rubrivivax gelatinosus]
MVHAARRPSRHPARARRRGRLPAALAALAAAPVLAQPVETIVVTGSVAGSEVQQAPYAIGVVDREALRQAGPMINLSEALARVPGLVVANRSNYAQDLQISSRGFGARAGFGVRGLRLLADGIPASGPDGQGQVSHIDLAGADRVEVLRGPFSALYGNSSGGVISVFSAPVRRAEAEAGLDLGTYGLRQLRAAVQAPLAGGFELRASGSAMDWEGFRPHSEAERRLGNLRLGWRGEADTVIAVASHYEQPADDPLGLTREQFDADPRQTTPQAESFDTRKRSKQDQLGVNWRHRFADGALREFEASAYAGQRSVTQWLAIAKATQDNPRHGGGVADFDRDYRGAQAQWRWNWQALDLMAGAALEDQRDDRRGYENYVLDGAGDPVYGRIGTQRRDEINRARTRDLFGQAEWRFAPDWAASAGLRRGRVTLSADDAYRDNGDDSGRLSYDYTNPVLGLRWRAAPGLNLHAAAARGFEAPTLGELAYRPDGANGFNEGLKAQKSLQFEVGAKWRQDESLDLDLALFQVMVDDEIGIASNAGGRASYQNVGRTLRRGAELGAGWRPAAAWRTRLALTLLDARYRDDFLTCAGIPCTTPTAEVAAGKRIAGTQRASAFAELAWRDAALGEWGLEWRAAGRSAANDRNTDFASGYALAALRWSRTFAIGEGQRIELLARIDNLFDRAYAGSLIVNDANGRYFETGAPRSALLALRWVGAI